jgi:predicted Rossmann fold nucleotide-binding protein DprA/Smf involved in DNA uptake
LGATPARNPEDILEALKLDNRQQMIDYSKNKTKRDYTDCNEQEKKIIELLNEPLERDILIRTSGLPASEAQTLLTLLEMKGYIEEILGEIRLR